MKGSLHLARLQVDVGYLHHDVIKHPVFKQIVDIPSLRCFMEHHVFAVWCFMHLSEVFYKKVAGTQASGFPPQTPDGLLEDYRKAMTHCDANQNPIHTFLNQLQKGTPLPQVLYTSGVPTPAKSFIESTWAILDKPAHAMAAAFVFEYEGVMGYPFYPLLKKTNTDSSSFAFILPDCLQQHIHPDRNGDYPKALALLEYFCGEDSVKWQEATQTATKTLQAQYNLWTAIAAVLPHSLLQEPVELVSTYHPLH